MNSSCVQKGTQITFGGMNIGHANSVDCVLKSGREKSCTVRCSCVEVFIPCCEYESKIMTLTLSNISDCVFILCDALFFNMRENEILKENKTTLIEQVKSNQYMEIQYILPS